MTEDLRARAVRLKHWLREHNIPGGCRILSQGDQCQCPLCDVDALLARAEAAEAKVAFLTAEVQKNGPLALDLMAERARAEAAEQQLQALHQENAELLAVIASWHRKWDAAQASLTQPGAAQGALSMYLQHLADCELIKCVGGRVDVDTPEERLAECTCGLATLIQESK